MENNQKMPHELFEELKKEIPFIPNEEEKMGLIIAFAYQLLF